jgi:hypothetical protein
VHGFVDYFFRADLVLPVKDIKKLAPKLGTRVVLKAIEYGKHHFTLSIELAPRAVSGDDGAVGRHDVPREGRPARFVTKDLALRTSSSAACSSQVTEETRLRKGIAR